jgi:hypothetical protein
VASRRLQVTQAQLSLCHRKKISPRRSQWLHSKLKCCQRMHACDAMQACQLPDVQRNLPVNRPSSMFMLNSNNNHWQRQVQPKSVTASPG